MTKLIATIGAITLLICSGFIVYGYLKGNNSGNISNSSVSSLSKEWDRRAVDSALSLLRDGDIVIRRGVGPDSYMLAEMNRDDKTWSHCGIVLMEHGYPFVYHSIGGEDNPDERLRRDSASFFFSPTRNTHIGIVRYDLGVNEQGKLDDIVRNYYRARPRFDIKFDLSTDDRLYCSEFVYKAVNAATGDSSYIKPYYRANRRMVAIDNLFLNKHARLLTSIKFK
jgi:hypothetical protein